MGVYCFNYLDGLNIESVKSKTWLLLWLLVFTLTFVWRTKNLDAFGLTNDEGAHLMWAQLAREGQPLYQETQAVQSPLFLGAVRVGLQVGGPTIAAGRWAMLVGYGLLAVALSGLAYRAGGGVGAVVAMVLVGLAPLIFTFSRLVMAEVPATGLAVFSLLLLFIFLDRGHRLWLLASGVALGLSFIFKALNPFIIAPVGLLLMWPATRQTGKVASWETFRLPLMSKIFWRSLLFNSLGWAGGVLLPIFALLLSYDPAILYDQLIVFRGDLRAAIPGSWAETWQQFSLLLHSHWGLWLLAGGGLISAGWRHWIHPKIGQNQADPPDNLSSFHYTVVWLVWLLAGLMMLAWHTPLFYHHQVVLMPPLILLGAGFITDLVALWPWAAVDNQPSALRWYGPVVGLSLLAVIAALNLPSMVAANQQTTAIVTGGREVQALELLQTVTNPNDFVMGDSQLLIFMAGRRTPPPLGDVALVAIKAGRQTSSRMITLSQGYEAAAVVQWSLRLPWLPEYLDWVQHNYLAHRVWDNDHIIHFVPRLPPNHALPHEQRVRLGADLILRGYDFAETAIKAGQHLNLKVYWQAAKPVSANYTIFTQLLDSKGVLVTSWDSQPLGGHFPTNQWPPHEVITDRVSLPLPSDLPPGEYTLITGMYRLETLERLTTSAGNDHITLTTITVGQ